jgi:hypothetical protein
VVSSVLNKYKEDGMVKRKIIVMALAVVLLLAGGVMANAQFRLDANIQVPFFAGLNLDSLGISGGGSIGAFIPFPSVEAAWQFPIGPIKIGVGARAYTVIIESFAWPNAFVELDLNPIVLRADFGGGAFLLFGIATTAYTAAMVLPQIDVSWRLADWFRLGVGAIGIAPFEDMSNFGYAIYVSGRFTALFK